MKVKIFFKIVPPWLMYKDHFNKKTNKNLKRFLLVNDYSSINKVSREELNNWTNSVKEMFSSVSPMIRA